jgi:hypothetical protein
VNSSTTSDPAARDLHGRLVVKLLYGRPERLTGTGIWRLEAILNLRLVKYADPDRYQAFLDELLQRSTKTAISCELSVETTRGKV